MAKGTVNKVILLGRGIVSLLQCFKSLARV